MLYKTTFSPSALKIQENECSLFVRLLQDLNKNCLILVDPNGEMEKLLTNTIQELPPKYNRIAKEYHKSLKSKGRVVRQSAGNQELADEDLCDFYRWIMSQSSELLMFIGSACCLESVILPKSRLIKLEDYTLSRKFNDRQENRIFLDGEASKEELEKEVIHPLFETSKVVKIIDRYIGRSMIKKNNKGEIKIERTIVERYKKSIIWLLEIFDYYYSQSDRIFEIYTGIDSSVLTNEEAKYLYNNLMNFSDEVRRKFQSFNFNLKVKKETLQDKEMPHARYLITNQISVLVDCGFDLFWSDDRMYKAKLNPRIDEPKIRDVAIALISEPGKVEESIRTLPDLSSSFS